MPKVRIVMQLEREVPLGARDAFTLGSVVGQEVATFSERMRNMGFAVTEGTTIDAPSVIAVPIRAAFDPNDPDTEIPPFLVRQAGAPVAGPELGPEERP